ncbi:MAG: hypothetical protein QNK37_17950 [Acidobacteriota bacterium]|nr:hypothetical protein [Acidobacteriota bacterium]
MIDSKYLEFLKTANTDENPHSERSLTEHLIGCYNLLKEWGNTEDICLAGLFHSIYGTESYPLTTISAERRLEVKQVIGEKAENLVNLFCRSERSSFFTTIEDPSPLIRDSDKDELVPITKEELKGLIELEVANVVEFIPHRNDIPAKLKNYYTYLFGLDDRYMTQGAQNAWRNAFQ